MDLLFWVAFSGLLIWVGGMEEDSKEKETKEIIKKVIDQSR
jgi:hypothetical protein